MGVFLSIHSVCVLAFSSHPGIFVLFAVVSFFIVLHIVVRNLAFSKCLGVIVHK